jgi:hypothetical protein
MNTVYLKNKYILEEFILIVEFFQISEKKNNTVFIDEGQR